MVQGAPEIEELVGRLLRWSDKTIEISLKVSRQEFLQDEILQLAATKGLELIGEASRLLLQHHPEFCASQPSIEWRRIVGMRNRLAHGYEGADIETVLYTIETFVPLVRDFAVNWLELHATQ